MVVDGVKVMDEGEMVKGVTGMKVMGKLKVMKKMKRMKKVKN